VDGGQKPRKYGGMKLMLSKFVHLQKPGPLGMLFPQWLPTAVQGLGQRPKASMTPFLPPYLRAFPPPLTRRPVNMYGPFSCGERQLSWPVNDNYLGRFFT
jgi:hypothetical protein